MNIIKLSLLGNIYAQKFLVFLTRGIWRNSFCLPLFLKQCKKWGQKMNEFGDQMHFCLAMSSISIRPFGLVCLKHWENQATGANQCPLMGQLVSAASSVLKEKRDRNSLSNDSSISHTPKPPGATFTHLSAFKDMPRSYLSHVLTVWHGILRYNISPPTI